MKVMCIDDKDTYLSIGKIYDVVEVKDNWYTIIISNTKLRFYKKYFKPLSMIRNDKIDKLLGI